MRAIRILPFFVISIFLNLSNAFSQDDAVDSYVETMNQSEQGMTLLEVIQSGGWVMAVLGVISVVMVTIIFFLAMRYQANKLVPEAFANDMLRELREGKFAVAKNTCEGNRNLISVIILAGLGRIEAGIGSSKEAVEGTAKKEVTKLWEPLSYLADIAAVAPMVGLLGTVIGMIKAFNTIAFQTAVVKPILLAGGVSQAMVTTAGGMVIAIIAMIFYSLFRFKVRNITDLIERYANEIVESFNQAASAKGG